MRFHLFYFVIDVTCLLAKYDYTVDMQDTDSILIITKNQATSRLFCNADKGGMWSCPIFQVQYFQKLKKQIQSKCFLTQFLVTQKVLMEAD